MPSVAHLLTLAAAASSASATYLGFNYDSAKSQEQFATEFKTAANLAGTKGMFTSARLYTMIKAGTENDPIPAIQAAIDTKTSLLFGLWASGDLWPNEMKALQKTVDQYCGQLDGMVTGISVGSEDLYRETDIARKNGENPGVGPDVLVKYIKEVREAIQGTCLSEVPIGHVDTWTAYDNSSNSAVLDNVDWVGMDGYPYYEDTKPNPIEKANDLLQSAIDKTKAAGGGKPVWITETGWPTKGEKFGDAVASVDNAEKFWKHAGCPRFDSMNVYWFTLQDVGANPSFGVVGDELSTTPLYDLSCDDVDSKPSTTSKSGGDKTSSEADLPGQVSTRVGQPISDSTTQVQQPETTTQAGGDLTETTSIPIDTPNTMETSASPPQTTGAMPTGGIGDDGSNNGDGGSDNGSDNGDSGSDNGGNGIGGSGQPTDDNSGSQTDGSDNPAQSEIPQSGAAQLNSLAAGAVAVILAAVAL